MRYLARVIFEIEVEGPTIEAAKNQARLFREIVSDRQDLVTRLEIVEKSERPAEHINLSINLNGR